MERDSPRHLLNIIGRLEPSKGQEKSLQLDRKEKGKQESKWTSNINRKLKVIFHPIRKTLMVESSEQKGCLGLKEEHSELVCGRQDGVRTVL